MKEGLGAHLYPRVLHSDNGSPMKGATMLEIMYNLGVVSSFSRLRASNDNAYAEFSVHANIALVTPARALRVSKKHENGCSHLSYGATMSIAIEELSLLPHSKGTLVMMVEYFRNVERCMAWRKTQSVALVRLNEKLGKSRSRMAQL